MSHQNYPDLVGVWSYQIINLRRTNPITKPSFSNIIESQYNIVVEQQNQFIIATVPPNPPLRPTEGYQLGLINQVYNNIDNFWQLTIADFDDTGVINLTIKEYETDCNCDCVCDHDLISDSSSNSKPRIRPTVLEGYYVESGFSTTNPDQNQAIAQITWTRIN